MKKRKGIIIGVCVVLALLLAWFIWHKVQDRTLYYEGRLRIVEELRLKAEDEFKKEHEVYEAEKAAAAFRIAELETDVAVHNGNIDSLYTEITNLEERYKNLQDAGATDKDLLANALQQIGKWQVTYDELEQVVFRKDEEIKTLKGLNEINAAEIANWAARYNALATVQGELKAAYGNSQHVITKLKTQNKILQWVSGGLAVYTAVDVGSSLLRSATS